MWIDVDESEQVIAINLSWAAFPVPLLFFVEVPDRGWEQKEQDKDRDRDSLRWMEIDWADFTNTTIGRAIIVYSRKRSDSEKSWDGL